MADCYRVMFPPFVPNLDLPEKPQAQFYAFMKEVLQKLFDDPEGFFKKIYADDAYPNRFNRKPYNKPDLIVHMKKDVKDIDEFLTCLFEIGRNGEVAESGMKVNLNVSKKQVKNLNWVGLSYENGLISSKSYPHMFPAWSYLAKKEAATVLTFSRCFFYDRHSYLEDVYVKLFDKKAFEMLTGWLKQHEYKRYELTRPANPLDYVKSLTAREVELGNSISGDPHHIGFAYEYKYEAQVPQYAVPRIVRYKDILLHFAEMPENLQKFVLNHTKHCDNCRYCTQTDKSGKRPQATVFVTETVGLCPYYPGFSISFTEIDTKRAADIIELMEFMEKILIG
jgi:hypothetical protein